MEACGFERYGTGRRLSIDFMDGDFTAVIHVDRDGSVSGRVRDNMNDEEYAQLRNPNFNGAYVNTVRNAYEELLEGIAAECCSDVAFVSDQSNRIAAWILSEYGVAPDFPWDDDRYGGYGVFRHHGSRKWFGLIMNIKSGLLDGSGSGEYTDIINLKIDEVEGEQLRSEKGIYPAWHMNHRTWISVVLDDSLTDEWLHQLIAKSFKLTFARPAAMSEEVIMAVLDTANSIPYGKVASYGQIARIIGREHNSRMVGRIMSMADRYGEYPCHRVVNQAGRTVPGWPEQRELLEAEGVEFKANGCVDMKRFRWEK